VLHVVYMHELFKAGRSNGSLIPNRNGKQ